MTKCMIFECKEVVNKRGKFCEHHDKIERDLCARFEKKIDSKSEISRDELKRFQVRAVK